MSITGKHSNQLLQVGSSLIFCVIHVDDIILYVCSSVFVVVVVVVGHYRDAVIFIS